jgi:uncharacterized protein YndB with AHSA1/START domain
VAKPTISKHIQILNEYELVEANQQGCEIYYRLKIDKIKKIDKWLEQFRQIWKNVSVNWTTYWQQLKAKKMKSKPQFEILVDKGDNTVNIKREFRAPKDTVWAAWTEPELLDQWWAPEPLKARTKKMDFREGGQRLYAMVDPEGEEHWCLADYLSITPKTNFKHRDALCDYLGHIDQDFPRSDWNVDFTEENDSTMENVVIKHKTLADLEKKIEMASKKILGSYSTV